MFQSSLQRAYVSTYNKIDETKGKNLHTETSYMATK
jgi:hypothetical protein